MTGHSTSPIEGAGPCLRCGVESRFRNTAGRCTDCHNVEYHEYTARRKAQLAAEPRCEVDGCKRRGAWLAGHDQTLLCGQHLKAARRKASSFGVLALGQRFGRELLLNLAD